MIRRVAEALHHAAAYEAPAQRTHHFPEHYAIRIDLAARLLVTRKQIVAGAKAADRLVDLAKAPGVDADPAEILHGIAEMSDLPVQHGPHAVGADDEIAIAKIAMHQRRLARCARIVIGEPAQRELEYRTRPVGAAVFAREIGDRLSRGIAAQLRQLRFGQAMNAGGNPAELARKKRPCLGERLVAQNLARDGLALDPD